MKAKRVTIVSARGELIPNSLYQRITKTIKRVATVELFSHVFEIRYAASR